MASFWTDRPSYFIHRAMPGDVLPLRTFAVVYEHDETTVISEENGPGASGPYTCLTLGPFDLDLVGILSKASEALAKAGIPIFVISTFRYDHILVPSPKAQDAEAALIAAGFDRKS